MNSTEKDSPLHLPEDFAARVLETPQHFKICLICKAIIERELPGCPHCYGYRFNEESEEVADHLLTLAQETKTAISVDDRYED